MSIQEKIRANAMMWTMILISTVFFIDGMVFQAVLVVVGLIGTTMMGFVKVRKD